MSAGGEDACDLERELGLSIVARVVAECLERVDREGAVAIEEVCAEHPGHADELRRRLSTLRDLGLLSQGRVGHYRLLRTLGHGGMGLVYLARDERLQRVVALKALPSRLTLNPRALKRFQREIRAAAQLHHPRIVPIYDVGEADGVPYFTMEYVEGRTLADIVDDLTARACDPRSITLEDLAAAADPVLAHEGDTPAGNGHRTAQPSPRPVPEHWGSSYVETVCLLVLDVADALAHAHAHGVVHRDVKPSNVLVRGDGRAQLFDFGLARIEADEAMTITGDFTGTPYYVSPEQITAREAELDRRTDVYSLGVTLFELLTLRRPFDGRTTQEIFRAIVSREPALPRKLNPHVPRDLETICLTAIEKDPDRRYQSAGELAADLRRLLSFHPVQARPVGRVTRLLRLARRNRATSIAAVLGALMVVGAPAALWRTNAAIRAERDEAERQGRIAAAQAERAEQERERAESHARLAEEQRAVAEEQRERAEAQQAEAETQRRWAEAEARKVTAINQLLLDMLAAPNPEVGGRDVTVGEVLDRFAASIGAEFADAPELEIAARTTLGNTWLAMKHIMKAREQFLAAYELAKQHVGRPGSLVTEASMETVLIGVGTTSAKLGMVKMSTQAFERALELGRRRTSGPDESVASVLNNFAVEHTMRGDEEGALRLFEEALAMRRELFGDDHRDVAESLVNIALLVDNMDQHERSEQHYRESLAIQRRVLGANDPLTVTTLRNLALLIGPAGRWEEAIALYREALPMAIAVYGEEHREVAQTRAALALLLRERGDWAAVEEQLDAAVTSLRAVDPTGHSDFAGALRGLGEARAELGRPGEAVPLLREALGIERRDGRDDSRDVVATLDLLVDAERELGRYAEAEALLLEFETSYAALGAADHWKATVTTLRAIAEQAGWTERAALYEQMLAAGLDS